MVDEMDVHWLSDDQFYVEIDGLGDDEIVDETPSSSVVVDYKKPTVVRFNTKRMKVKLFYRFLQVFTVQFFNLSVLSSGLQYVQRRRVRST